MTPKPSIEGGQSVREKDLAPFQPYIEEAEIEETIDSLKSGWITTGPKVKEFEKNVREYIGIDNSISVNSCTAGLHLCLIVNNIGKGDEVITSPYTFTSTVNVIEHANATPVLVDVDKETFNIDPGKIEEKITENTKAIIPVHYGGHPCEMDKILEIADKHDLIVIEDAAHAIGAEYKNRKIGTIGDYTCFSFYATKNLTTAEGGMITTDKDEKAEELEVSSLHGMDKDAWKRYSDAGSWYYDVVTPGYKYNMTDLQAAIGLHQLKKFNEMQERRKEIADQYNSAFKDMSELIIPPNKDNIEHAWHLYPLQIKEDMLSIDRNEFIEALDVENIGTSVHFIPVHMHSYYREKYNYKSEDFPNAKKMYEREISIPLYPKMKDKDVNDVINGVKKIVEYYKE